MNNFDSLQLPAPVGRAVARLGFSQPTPIQAQAIPIALQGKDLIGCAQTGTGKTAAFCIPIYTQFLEEPRGLALVLVPTRELAKQIEDFWRQLTQGNHAMGSTSLIGGMPMNPQIRALRKNPRLVIATPGRLIDHLDRRTIDLRGTSILVLDEADRMLDMGFEPQLSRIAKYVPKQRQTLLFSATLPPEAERLSAKFVVNPSRVSIGTVSRAAATVTQSMVMTEPPKKNEALLEEINRWEKDSILIFARTKARTDRVAKYLNTYGLKVARIHGDRSQGQRTAALNDFRSGKARILVATDIAARGIDVASVGFVINYDLPHVPEDYVHRIGRTGRAGASGEAVSLVTREERTQWRDIVNLLKKTGSAIPAPRTGGKLTLEALDRLDRAPMQVKPQQLQAKPQQQHQPRHQNQPRPGLQPGGQPRHGQNPPANPNNRRERRKRWHQRGALA
jgi:superfamily II DNA/RNA helicase